MSIELERADAFNADIVFPSNGKSKAALCKDRYQDLDADAAPSLAGMLPSCQMETVNGIMGTTATAGNILRGREKPDYHPHFPSRADDWARLKRGLAPEVSNKWGSVVIRDPDA